MSLQILFSLFHDLEFNLVQKAWLKCSLLTLEGHGLSQGLLRSRAHDGADEQLIKQVMMKARVCSVGGRGRRWP